MRCKHPQSAWDEYRYGLEIYDAQPRRELVIMRRCRRCDSWLSLGPSDESDPRIAVEIRAFDLANRVTEQRARGKRTFLSKVGFDGAEVAGWLDHQYDSQKSPEQPGEHAGYLARAICEHDKDPR